jgi:hypothetical protein
MKAIPAFLVFASILFASCKREEFTPTGDGISITFGDKVTLTSKDIDFYSFSSHLIYLKGDNSFMKEGLYRDSFQVFANAEKIYSGYINSWISSYMPSGPVIYAPATFYPNYVVPIGFNGITDASGKSNVDPRGDVRIVRALKDVGQFQEGLKCEFRSLQFNAKNKLVLQLALINDDSINYLYLDPMKMGMGLFHYFTNGLSLWDATSFKSYSNHVQYIQPDPYNSWEKDWLSVIEKHSEKTIVITYDNFDEVPSGKYRLTFSFPGLTHVEKADLFQQNGRIWLGDLHLSQDFQIR